MPLVQGRGDPFDRVSADAGRRSSLEASRKRRAFATHTNDAEQHAQHQTPSLVPPLTPSPPNKVGKLLIYYALMWCCVLLL